MGAFDLSESNDMASALIRARMAVDHVYGDGFSKANPDIAVLLLQAHAMTSMSAQLAELQHTLASGSGTLTVGFDK